MKLNRITSYRRNTLAAASIGILLLSVTCANAQAQCHSAKLAHFTTTMNTNVAFGVVALGTPEQKTFMYTNTGSDTLFIQSLELNADSAFTIQFATLTLPPQRSGKVIVQFAPHTARNYNGSITFDVAGSGASPTLALTGNGTELVATSAVAFGH